METVDIIFIVLAAIFGVAIMALLALSGIISKIDVRLKQNSNTDADKDITVVYNWIGWGHQLFPKYGILNTEHCINAFFDKHEKSVI